MNHENKKVSLRATGPYSHNGLHLGKKTHVQQSLFMATLPAQKQGEHHHVHRQQHVSRVAQARVCAAQTRRWSITTLQKACIHSPRALRHVQPNVHQEFLHFRQGRLGQLECEKSHKQVKVALWRPVTSATTPTTRAVLCCSRPTLFRTDHGTVIVCVHSRCRIDLVLPGGTVHTTSCVSMVSPE